MKTFISKNKAISIFLFVSIIIFFAYLFTMEAQKVYPTMGTWFNVLFQISIGYIVNFLFYVTQIYSPKIAQEKHLYLIFQPLLNELFFALDDFIPFTDSLIKIEKDTLSYPSKIIYCKYFKNTTQYFDSINLDKHFSYLQDTVSEIVTNIITNNAFYLCDSDIVELITRIKVSKFLEHLDCLYKSSYSSKFGGLSSEYLEFKNIFDSLVKVIDTHAKDKYVKPIYTKLSDEEVEEYLKYKDEVLKSCGDMKILTKGLKKIRYKQNNIIMSYNAYALNLNSKKKKEQLQL